MPKSSGQIAEEVAEKHLKDLDHKILARNWKTPYCEIDIVTQLRDTIYFVEVKYRKSRLQGSGMDYITPSKLKQMHFAAEMWLHDNKWHGPAQLAALEVAGETFNVTDFIEVI